MPDGRVKIVHWKCGELVFWYDFEPISGVDEVWAKYATLPDGSKPSEFDLILCPNCGPAPIFELEPEGGWK